MVALGSPWFRVYGFGFGSGPTRITSNRVLGRIYVGFVGS